MLGQAVTLTLLLFLQVPQGQECPDSTNHVVGLSGESLQLWLNTTQTNISSVEWKMQLASHSSYQKILTWRNGSNINYESSTSNNISSKSRFIIKNLTLFINAAQQQDSGLYCVEVTNETGNVWRSRFEVLVFDEIEKPLLLGQGKVLDGGRCQVSLYCSVSRDSNVSYAWYRGSELIQRSRNVTHLEIDADGMYIYTCNVSNPVSWKTHTLNFTKGCQNAQEFRFGPFLVTTVILITLLLGTLACFCVWKRKRKQPQTSAEEFLTIYEDVKDLQTRRNQEQKPKQNSPAEGSTIYSTIQSQSSASTSQETANTLYSFIQPSRKSGSKKNNHSLSFSSTIYEEVGKGQPKAQDPAKLSRKELESFSAYS
uniref:CD244 molecule n=1 Tax=Microcebus murinus TaxID=30608 RepID=A0A8C5XEB7_MICMU|nr:natural killer cell receptor 2B4 [Microcebus murinus]